MNGPVPVTIVTGFLGVGKTTFLNDLLRRDEAGRTAVIVNEFGAIGLDHALVEAAADDIVLLPGGCLCCSARGDLVPALGRCLDRGAAAGGLDRILIETSGLADPAPLLNLPLADAGLLARCRLAGLVTLIDAPRGLDTARNHAEAEAQLALADAVVITQADRLADPAAGVARLRAAVAERLGGIPVLSRAEALADAGALLALERTRRPVRAAPAEPRHGAGPVSLVLEAGCVPARSLEAFLALVARRFGASLLRLKGLAALAEDPGRPRVVQMVQHVLHPADILPAWPEGVAATRLVAITRGLPPGEIDQLWADMMGPPGIDRPDAAGLAGGEGGAGLFA